MFFLLSPTMDGTSENTSVLFPFHVQTQRATLLIITAFYEAILDYFKYFKLNYFKHLFCSTGQCYK